MFTGLNNFKVNTIADIKSVQYFGFTDDEVKDMLIYYEPDGAYARIKEWYDGYRFGKQEIYCPWDVINYCDKLLADKKHRPEAFWANSSSNYIIQDILSMASETAKGQIERLISGEAVDQRIIPELTYTDLDNEDITVRETYLWSVLYAAGYLTKAAGETDSDLHRLVIPNKEVLQIYRDKICRGMLQEKLQGGLPHPCLMEREENLFMHMGTNVKTIYDRFSHRKYVSRS